MLEFACHTWAFNDLTLPEALGTIARLGFRYVDIGSGANFNAARAAANPKKAAAEINEDLRSFNLQLSDLYLMLPRISLADEEKREKDLELYTTLLPFAAALHTPGITLSPGLVQAADADPDAQDRTIAALQQMVQQGQEVGLRVSIEPHLDSMAHTPEAALKLVNDVPGLEITLDWAHMICQGFSQDNLRPLLPHTRHVQMRQAAKGKLQTPLDKGQIDLQSVVMDLNAAGYSGVVCIEYMNTPGWHGMVAVDTLSESVRLRDTLRAARNSVQGTP